jgi:hypothetical protein
METPPVQDVLDVSLDMGHGVADSADGFLHIVRNFDIELFLKKP